MAGLVKPKMFSMQSGPGKHCDEKYNAFQLQNAQLSARKFIPSLQLPDFLSKMQRRLPPEALDQLIEETQRVDSKRTGEVAKQQVSQSWVFNAQSRSDYYRAVDRKDRVPSTGYYTPKYSGVYPNVAVPVITPAAPAKLRRINGSRASEAGPIPEYPRRVHTATVFSLQTKRPNPTLRTVSDQRFEFVNEPLVYSKVKRIVSPDLSKSLRRKTLVQPISSPRYDPKFEAVWKKDLPTIDFGKLTGRSDEATPPATQLSYDNVRFSQTNARPSAVRFNASRPETGFPAHMVGVTSRVGLTVLQESSLVMSAFPFHASVCGALSKNSSIGRSLETANSS